MDMRSHPGSPPHDGTPLAGCASSAQSRAHPPVASDNALRSCVSGFRFDPASTTMGIPAHTHHGNQRNVIRHALWMRGLRAKSGSIVSALMSSTS